MTLLRQTLRRLPACLMMLTCALPPLTFAATTPQKPPTSTAAAPATPPKQASLQSLAGWNAYALGNLTVTNVTSTTANAFSGRLLINGAPPELSPTVLGFRPAANSPMLLALIYSGRDFSAFLPALKGTPTDDLRLNNLVAVLAPPGLNPATPMAFPAAINGIPLPALGGTTRPLNGATSVFADLSLANNSARLIQAVGASGVNLQLAGAVDPRMLLGGIPPGSQIETDLINALSFTISLGKNLGLNGSKPAFLTLGDSSLLIKGVGGKIASGISTSLAVNVGNGLRFDAVSINHDPVKDTLAIQSGAIVPTGNWLSLPVAGANINQLAFNATLDPRNPASNSFRLDGKYSLANAVPQAFSVALSGGSPAQYQVSVNSDITLGQLLGWHPPGLDAIALRNVTAGSNYTSAQITLQGLEFTAIVFKGSGQKSMNAAFIYNAPLTLPTMVSALRGTPLDDLQLTHPAFVLSPAENGMATVALPAPLATHLGMPSLALNPGLNLSAQTKPQGELAVLLSKLNLANLTLPLKGNLDLSVLTSKPGDVVQNLINSLDLRIPLPSPKPSWKPDFLTLGDSTLMVKGIGGKIATGISTSLAVNVGNGLRFDAVSINHDPLKQTISLQSGNITPTGNWLTLPVTNARIQQLAFNALIDENNRANTSFKLNGQYTVANAAPESFSVTLSGGSPAQYAVSVNANMTLGQLLGWHPPGLDAIALRNVAAGNNYTSAEITLQGLDFTVIAFKAPGQKSMNAAFTYNAPLKLPSLMAALQNTPLGDLELSNPAFVLSPSENGTGNIALPTPVASHLGLPSLNIKPGLNLSAQTRPLGELATLLSKFNLSNASLPLTGSLDPSLLMNKGGELAQAFISGLDLSIPLGRIAVPGARSEVAMNNAVLSLKGLDKGIDTAIKGNIAITAGSTPLSFDSTIRLTKTATGDTLSISGTSASNWPKPLDIPWLSVRNLNLHGSVGQTNEIAVSGTTDVGNIRNLTVTVDIASKPNQTPEVLLMLTGADIPFTDIPGLSSIPKASEFKLRDLVLSNQEIGGTLKSNTALFKDAQAMVFQSAGRWNLAVLLEGVGLAEVVPLPKIATPVLGKVKLGKLAVVLSEAGINSRVADLPKLTSQEFVNIFGTPQAQVQMGNGINLISALEPAQLGPVLSKMMPAGQAVTLQGAVNGIFGGTPTLALAANIPPITLPATLKFAAVPQNAPTSFFINLSEAAVATGIRIDVPLKLAISGQAVTFDSSLAFQLDSSGGVSIDLQGKTLSPWDNAVGIRGLTMDTGTRIELKVSATSEVTLTFVGKSHIGKREVDLTGSASVLLADGMIDKGAFEGKLSELDIEDLMTLTNGVVAATGGQPIQHDLPVLKLTKLDVAFASPGVSIPEMKLDGGGIRVAGDLWFMLKDQALGRANVAISENGLRIDGKLADFSTGPIAFKNNQLDVKATLTPPAPPYFMIHGGVNLFGKAQDAGLTLSGINMEVQTDLDLGNLLQFDFKANAGIPPGGLSPQALSKYDLSLNARLKADIPGWLRKDGRKPVETMVSGVKQGMAQLIKDFNAAQSAVNDLNTKINAAKTEARKTAKSAQSMLTDAQNKVDSLEQQITKMKSRISDAKDNIHKCDYTKSTKIFGKKISAPDISRNIRCAADNIDYGAKVVSLEAQRDSLMVSKSAADNTLSIIKSGIGDTDVADLDPKVIELEGELTIATGTLEAAKSLAQGIEQGDQLLANALNKFAQGNVFVLKDSLIEGSVQKAIAGRPVVMGLSFEAAGQESHLDFALSFTDPAFTASQLEALALYVFSQVLQTAAKDGATLPPGLLQLVHQAYIAKSDAVAAELAKAMKENGL